jgi:hypothetical protein
MLNEIDRLVAQAKYHDMVRAAEQRALFGALTDNRPGIQSKIALIIADFLLACSERVRRYGKAEISKSVLKV